MYSAPDGEWLIEPITDTEGLTYATLDFNRLEERQILTPQGTIQDLMLPNSPSTERQSTLDIID